MSDDRAAGDITIKPFCGGWIALRGNVYVASGKTRDECERKAEERANGE